MSVFLYMTHQLPPPCNAMEMSMIWTTSAIVRLLCASHIAHTWKARSHMGPSECHQYICTALADLLICLHPCKYTWPKKGPTPFSGIDPAMHGDMTSIATVYHDIHGHERAHPHSNAKPPAFGIVSCSTPVAAERCAVLRSGRTSSGRLSCKSSPCTRRAAQ